MTTSPFLDEILIRARKGMGKTSVSGAKPRSERMWKALTSTGSAFIKRIPGGGVQHGKQLAGQLAYVNGKAKGTFGFATGVHVGEDAFEQADLDQLIDAWSQDWKGRPRNGHTSHMVLSFPDDVSQAAARDIAQEWCVEMFESRTHLDETWEYVAALHTDTAHPHVHVVLNNRGVGGKWFSISSEGTFNPQMMRDRMTDIADDYGVRLESLTRADRGLYREPISSADVFAAREGRTLHPDDHQPNAHTLRQVEDIIHTADLYTTLADFAETIGAPMIAKRAHLSAAALFAGEEIPKGHQMTIDLDVMADREDIRTSLIGWAEQNAERIDALPAPDRADLMAKVDRALTLIETDGTPELTEDTVWAGFSSTPSSYLIPDVSALEARATLYVDDDDTDLMRKFVNENVLDTYLVTGKVADKYAAVMPAVAAAYEEMHSHRLADIPDQMQAYLRVAAEKGLDPAVMEQRLITAITDPTENAKIEREDIGAMVAAQRVERFDVAAFEQAVKIIDQAAEASVNHGIDSEEGVFENLAISFSNAQSTEGPDAIINSSASWAQVADELAHLADSAANRELTDSQSKLFEALAPVIYGRHKADMADGKMDAVDYEFKLADADRAILTPEQTSDQLYAEMKDRAVRDIKELDQKIAPYTRTNQALTVNAFADAQEDYRDLQMGLAKVEKQFIAETTIYDKDGVARLLQDVASTAATTGRADLADGEAGRMILKAFVALEGKDAMRELSEGNMNALADYVDTPAHQKLAAKELLKSAKSVDVGLDPREIEDGLEAVDPNYNRDPGISL